MLRGAESASSLWRAVRVCTARPRSTSARFRGTPLASWHFWKGLGLEDLRGTRATPAVLVGSLFHLCIASTPAACDRDRDRRGPLSPVARGLGQRCFHAVFAAPARSVRRFVRQESPHETLAGGALFPCGRVFHGRSSRPWTAFRGRVVGDWCARGRVGWARRGSIARVLPRSRRPADRFDDHIKCVLL